MQIFKGLLVCQIILWLPLFGFSQDDNLDQSTIITYDFTTNRFDKIFPFDRPFTIHLANIPAAADEVKLELYEYNMREIRQLKNRTITRADLLRSKRLYELEKWKRGGVSATTGDVQVEYSLKPNTNYLLVVNQIDIRHLTNAEMLNVTSQLMIDPNINNTINTLAEKFLNNPGDSYNQLTSHAQNILLSINRGLQNINSDYKINEIDPSVVLGEASTFADELKNILDDLNELAAHPAVLADANSTTIQAAIVNARNRVMSLNWAERVNGDAYHIALTAAVTNITASFAGAVPATVTSNVGTINASVINAFAARDNLKSHVISSIVLPEVNANTVLQQSYRTSFTNHAKFYITLDAGYAYAFRMDRGIAYSGVNIYFRPINKALPMRGYDVGNWFLVRTSFLLGITLGSVEKDNTRKGLIDNKALVLGLGFRIVPFLKINGGTFLHYRYSTNPLAKKDRYYASCSPFISLSLDIDAKTLLSGVGDSIFK